MYNITARRMISGLVLKYLKEGGLVIPKRYATALPRSSKVNLTTTLRQDRTKGYHCFAFPDNIRAFRLSSWIRVKQKDCFQEAKGVTTDN